MRDASQYPTDRRLESGPLRYEPRNEQGVVALFAGICEERFGLKIQHIETGFPDCEAVRVKGGRRVWIEFEFASSRFDHQEWWKCDWVVCWVDNSNRGETWRRGTATRRGLRVVELRAEFPELGPDVWIQPYKPENVKRLDQLKRHREWTVPSEAARGDLLLVYQSQQNQGITHILEVTTPAEYDSRHGWGSGYKADLRTVIKLPKPVPREDLQRHPRLRSVSFFRRPSPLGTSVLPSWPAIERLMLDLNPRAGIRKALAPFTPKPSTAREKPPEKP
jgi:hypothetical protein